MPMSADRVKETTASTGTSAVSLDGATPGYRAFDAAFTVGPQFYYVIVGATAWEVGIGHLSASTTLVRGTVLSSSTGAVIDFPAGTKEVFCALPASVHSSMETEINDLRKTLHSAALSF